MKELNFKNYLSKHHDYQLKLLLNPNIVQYSNYKIFLKRFGDESCFIYTFNKNDLNSLKNIKIYGIFESLQSFKGNLEDLLYMEVGVKLYSSGTPLEIKAINAGNLKRCGRGSTAIKFLEEALIPELNKILKSHNYNENIQYIYGISAELSPETNALARAKFYSKNGFTISHSHFYKYL